jgi:hypothetical protein
MQFKHVATVMNHAGCTGWACQHAACQKKSRGLTWKLPHHLGCSRLKTTKSFAIARSTLPVTARQRRLNKFGQTRKKLKQTCDNEQFVGGHSGGLRSIKSTSKLQVLIKSGVAWAICFLDLDEEVAFRFRLATPVSKLDKVN